MSRWALGGGRLPGFSSARRFTLSAPLKHGRETAGAFPAFEMALHHILGKLFS